MLDTETSEPEAGEGTAAEATEEGAVLGDPHAEQARREAESAQRQLEVGMQMGMQMMEERMAHASEMGQQSNYGRHSVAEIEELRGSMAQSTAAEDMRRSFAPSMAAELYSDNPLPQQSAVHAARFAFGLDDDDAGMCSPGLVDRIICGFCCTTAFYDTGSCWLPAVGGPALGADC